MPSNTQPVSISGDGRVRCQIVHDDIPTDICSKEQNAEDCEGCHAPTRRCTACKKVRGIADAERGLCATCATAAGAISRTTSFDGTPDKAIAKVLDRVRTLAVSQTPDHENTPQAQSHESRESVLKPSPHLDDPLPLFHALMEHAALRGKEGIISAPISILMRRFHLLREEAVEALNLLAKEGYFDGKEPWEKLLLNRMTDIKAIEARLETPRGQQPYEPAAKKPMRQREAKPSPDSRGATHHKPKADQERKEVRPTTPKPDVITLPSSKPLATYGEIYEYLQSRSHEVRDERVIGGALPLLQIRFKLNPSLARESLEWLERHGCVERKDEWRSIRLLSPPTQGADDGPARIPSQATVRPKPPSKQPMLTAPHQPTPQGMVEQTTKLIAPVPVGSANWLSQSIALLEREVAPLRKKRDDLSQRIALLEAGLALLKKAETDLASAKDGADTSLADVAQLIRQLLSHLPQK